MIRVRIRQKCLRFVWIVVGGVFCGAGGPPMACCGPVEMPPDAQISELPGRTNAVSWPDLPAETVETCG